MRGGEDYGIGVSVYRSIGERAFQSTLSLRGVMSKHDDAAISDFEIASHNANVVTMGISRKSLPSTQYPEITMGLLSIDINCL